MVKNEKPWVLSQRLEMTFTQDADCCSIEEQYLTVFTENGGGGDYYVMQTDRWAFDSIPELVETLMRFYNKHSKVKQKNDSL